MQYSEKTSILSVCIPVYNGGDHLVTSVKSILGCPFSEVEVVVNDNHSGDDSINQLKMISDNRLKVFVNEKNEGPFRNCFLALSRGTGKYLMLLQDNDELVIENLGKYIDFLYNTNAIAIKNGIFSLRNKQGFVCGAEFLYYSNILNHFSMSVYLRDVFQCMSFKRDCFDIKKTAYCQENWDIQIVANTDTLKKKEYYLNADIKIIQVPERVVESRTRSMVKKMPFASYSYESYVYYFNEKLNFIHEEFDIESEFIICVLYIFYATVTMVTYRYYENMHDKNSAKRYGIPFINYSKKEWIQMGGKFYKEILPSIEKIKKLSTNEKIIMKLMVSCNSALFEAEHFTKQRNFFNLRYIYLCLKIRFLRIKIEKRLEIYCVNST